MAADFFNQYFIEPLVSGTGYNPINTLAYAFLFLIFIVIVDFILKKIRIKVDRELALAITPFIVTGVFVRVMEDSGILVGHYLKSPFIWIAFFFIILGSVLISVSIERKKGIPYYKLMFVVGTVLAGISSGVIRYTNYAAIFYFLMWYVPFLLLIYFMRWSFENKIVLSIQMFDAIATFVSLEYFGYAEQHVLPNIIIGLTGTPFSFVLVKMIVVIAALKIIDRYSEDENSRNILKFAIAILGLAPGLRDLTRLLAGV
jgi:uncharacterized membrane protein